MLGQNAFPRHKNTRPGAAPTAFPTSDQTIMKGSIMADAHLCAIDGCGKRAVARGFCSKHYQRWRKSASPSEVKTIAKAGDPLRWLADHVDYDGNDCLPWPFAKYPSGYGMLNLPNGGATMASRQMCREKHGDPKDEAMQAAHTCGNGALACTNPNHLYWATRSTNEGDKVGHGTSNRGTGNGHAKLTEETVRQIRASDLGPTALSNLIGVSAPTICDIRARRSWAWLED